MLKKLFYRLTAYVPRKLPTTELEYAQFKDVLIGYYDVPDNPKSWMTVAGHICSTTPERLRKPWGNIANCAKRLDVNLLAMNHKMKATDDLNEQLKQKFEEESRRIEQEELDKPELELNEKPFQPEADAGEKPQASTTPEDGTSKFLTAPEKVGLGSENSWE